jgi:hypothetical protein
MVIPSTPGLPRFLRKRFHALWRFSPSHTSSISCSVTAGLSGAGFATNGSALGSPLTAVSPRPCGSRASEYGVLCRLSTHELPVLLGTAHRQRDNAACCEIRGLRRVDGHHPAAPNGRPHRCPWIHQTEKFHRSRLNARSGPGPVQRSFRIGFAMQKLLIRFRETQLFSQNLRTSLMTFTIVPSRHGISIHWPSVDERPP